jgi:hypothetical protein
MNNHIGGVVLKETCTIPYNSSHVTIIEKMLNSFHSDYINNILYFPSTLYVLDYLWLVLVFNINRFPFILILNFTPYYLGWANNFSGQSLALTPSISNREEFWISAGHALTICLIQKLVRILFILL